MTTTAASLRRLANLTEILEALESAAITALVYKGPALAWQAYGHVGTRTFDDFDLLVAPADRAGAVRTLSTLGYTPDPEAVRLGAALPSAAHVDRLLPAAADRLPVEIHSSVAPWRLAARLPAEGSLARRVFCPLPTGPIPTLSPEDTLVALSVHASTHRWELLRFACEIAGVATRASVNWTSVVARAAEARVAREVRVGVLMARDLCATVFPSDVVAWAERDRVARALTADRIDALVTSRPAPSRLPRLGEHLRYREGLANKCRYAARNELVSWVLKVPLERWRRT